VKRALPFLRVAITLAGLWVAFWLALPDGLSELPGAWSSAWKASPAASAFAVGLATILFGASFLLGALRFSVLLRGAGLEADLPLLTRAYLVAGFINLTVPGGVAGDAYRWIDARRGVDARGGNHPETGRGAALAGILALERLLAIAALAGLGVFAVTVMPNSALARVERALLLAVGSAGVLCPFVLLHPRCARLARSAALYLESRLPRLGAPLNEALEAVLLLREQKQRLASAFLLSLAVQALPIAVVYTLSLPLASGVGWIWFAVVVPLVSLASLLPITIAGTGVREALYVALFGAVGMPREVALVLSLLVLGVAALWGGVGILLLAFGSARPAESPT